MGITFEVNSLEEMCDLMCDNRIPEERGDKSSDSISRADAIKTMEKINRVFADLGLACAYDMPSFWCHGGKDYKVIPTKYHKGYQQALSDAEKRIKLILEELCYE